MKAIKSIRRAVVIETGDVLLDFDMADGSTEAFSAPAILIVEMIKVVVRFALSPSTSDLRIVPIRTGPARYMSRWFNFMISVLHATGARFSRARTLT